MSQKTQDKSNWMQPVSRILCVKPSALLIHAFSFELRIKQMILQHETLFIQEKMQKHAVQCKWKIIRFVVTDNQILFYNHDCEYNIEKLQLQDVENLNISITSQSIAKDSLKTTQIKTQSISHESLYKVTDSHNLIVNQPPESFLDPLLLQHIQETGEIGSNKNQDIPILILYFKSREDVRQVQRAISLSQAWVKYKNACQAYSIEFDLDILDWIQEKIIKENTPFHVNLFHKSQDELDLYIECLNINNLKFTRDYTVDSNLMQDKHLLINVKYDQFIQLKILFNMKIELKFIEFYINLNLIINLIKFFQYSCYIDYQILKNLSDTICANINLEKLNMSHNLLTDDCLPLLSKVVESCTRLKKIDLSHNQFKGSRQYFYDFIDLINLLQIMDMDFEDIEYRLIFSHNQIGDDIVDVVEQLILLAHRPRITNLDLSYNKISKYNLWRLYKGFLSFQIKQKKDASQQIDYDRQINQLEAEQYTSLAFSIFPLPFHADILKEAIFLFQKMNCKTKKQNYIRQKKINQLKLLREEEEKQKEGNTIPNENYVEPQKENQSYLAYLENKTIDISIQRLRLGNKPIPNKKVYIQTIKDYKEKILKAAKDRYLTLEETFAFCLEIDNLEFEFPLKLLEPIYEVVWIKLCEALIIRDHYSISLSIQISKLIGLDLDFFEKNIEISELRKIAMMKKIERFLNFDDLPENDLNEELHFLIKESLRLDLRGPAVEQLFLIKEKRDEYIKIQIKEGFKPDQDLLFQDSARGDCFRYLNMNDDRKKVPKSIYQISINGNFFSHVTRADYALLSKLSQKTLIEYDDTIDIIKQKYESNYYIDLAFRRIQYFLEDFEDIDSDNPLTIFEMIFQEGLFDLKLACSRINIQYRNFQQRNIFHQHQLYQIKIPLTIRPYEVIYPVDAINYSQQYTLTNFMYLRKFEFYFTQNEISLQNLQPRDMFQHKNEDTFIKPLIQFPVPEAQEEVEKAMFLIISCIVYARESEGYKKIPYQLQQLIILLNKSQFQPHIKDEVYLQIFKYSTKHDINDYVEFNILAIISILTIYAPPSEELNHFVRVFLFKYYGRQRYTKIVQESLIALQSVAIDEIVLPDWTPSIFELEQRLNGHTKFIFKVFYPNQTSQEFNLDPYITAGEFMKIIYHENKYFISNQITDSYNYWIYQTNTYGEEEIAVMYEEILIELMSSWDQLKFQDFSFIIKRRIYQPFHQIRICDIHKAQMNCLLDEQLRYFYGNCEYAKSIPIPSLLRISSYYLVHILKTSPKVKIDPAFVYNQLKSLIPPYLKYNKEEFAFVISKMIEIEKIENLDKFQLTYNILVQMRFHNFYASSSFIGKINDSDVFIIVNAFCINIFRKKDYLKPTNSFYYEEIIHVIAVSQNVAIIKLFDKDSKKIYTQNITFLKNRAHEFVQDIISYSFLRLQDDNWGMYSYSELQKLRYRHFLLIAPVDCGLQDISDPYLLELNPNLNLIQVGETKERQAELNQHINKTQFIVPEATDYPFFKETTQLSLLYSVREMRRTSYQESQLQQWFNSVLKERKQTQDDLYVKQIQDNEQQKVRRDRVSAYGSANQNNVENNAVNTTPFGQIQQQNNQQELVKKVSSGSEYFDDKSQKVNNDREQQNNVIINTFSAIPEQISNSSQRKSSGGQLKQTQSSQNSGRSSILICNQNNKQQGYNIQLQGSMGAIPEVETGNTLSINPNKLDTQLDVITSPAATGASNDNLKHVNTAPSQPQIEDSQRLIPIKDNIHPQSATLPKKASTALTNQKLSSKISNALSIRPGFKQNQQNIQRSSVQSSNEKQTNQQQNLTDSKVIQKSQIVQQSPSTQQTPLVSQSSMTASQSKPPQPTSIQALKSSSTNLLNKNKEDNESKQDISPSQNQQLSSKNSEENTVLRHSRNSSKDGLKNVSPVQSKERLKSLSRTQQTIHAQNRRNTANRKSSNHNSKDNLNEQNTQNSPIQNMDGNNSQFQTGENESNQSSVNMPPKKAPIFLSKKKL